MTIRLNGQTSGYVELEAPDAAGSNTLVLPTNNGSSGDYLQTNGSGTLSWQSVTTGKILQVKSTAYTGTATVSTPPENFQDISGFSVDITPSSTNSKILVMVHVGRAGVNYNGDRQIMFRLMRGSTAIAVPPTADSRSLASFVVFNRDNSYNSSGSMTFLDSPSTTSATTYKVQMATQVDNEIVRINGSGVNTNNIDAPQCRTVSTITVMEVAA